MATRCASGALRSAAGGHPRGLGAAGVSGARVPFGPFLALAALEYVLLRSNIDAWFDWFYFGGAY